MKTISKQLLRFIFAPADNVCIKNTTLKKHFLTADFIEIHLKITEKEYQNIKNFDFKQSEIILNHFKITPEEIAKARKNRAFFYQNKRKTHPKHPENIPKPTPQP